MWTAKRDIVSPSKHVASERFSLTHLKQLYQSLVDNRVITKGNETLLVEILREIAEMIVYGDNKSELLFDFFCEKNILSLFLDFISSDNCPISIDIQILQTLSILINCIKNETSLYYLLSNHYINEIIMFNHKLSEDECLLDQFVSFLKSMSIRLNVQTIQFFFIEENDKFPLLSRAIEYLDSKEQMVRIAAQSIVLNVYKVNDVKAQSYSLKDDILLYLCSKITLVMQIGYASIGKLATEYARVYNSQVSLSSSSSYRKSVLKVEKSISENFVVIEDWLLYIADILSLKIPKLKHSLIDHIVSVFIVPTILNQLTDVYNKCKCDSETRDDADEAIIALTYLNLILKTIDDVDFQCAVLSYFDTSSGSCKDSDSKYSNAFLSLLSDYNERVSMAAAVLIHTIVSNKHKQFHRKSDDCSVCYNCTDDGSNRINKEAEDTVEPTAISVDVEEPIPPKPIILQPDNQLILGSFRAVIGQPFKHTLITIQTCIHTICLYVSIIKQCVGNVSLQHQCIECTEMIRTALQSTSKLLMHRTESHQGESVLFLLQDELFRLHGRRWSNVSNRLGIHLLSLLHHSSEVVERIGMEYFIPISSAEIIRREVQVYILLHALHMQLDSSKDSHLCSDADCICVCLEDDETFHSIRLQGEFASEFVEGEEIDMKGRRFLDAYYVLDNECDDGTGSGRGSISGGGGSTGGDSNDASKSVNFMTSVFSYFGGSSASSSSTSGSTSSSSTSSTGNKQYSNTFNSPTGGIATANGKVQRSTRNFGELLFVQDDEMLLIAVPGKTKGFSIHLVVPLLHADTSVDPFDKKVLRILVRSWRDDIPSMKLVGSAGIANNGTTTSNAAHDNSNGNNVISQYCKNSSLLKPCKHHSMWTMTVCFETLQGCMLASQHIERRRLSFTEEKINNCKDIFALYIDNN